MSQNQTPIEPLSVGNVVSAGLRIYRDHFKSYFGLSVIVSLWSFLPFVLLIPIVLLFIFSQLESQALLILIPLCLLLILYSSGKSIVNGSIIARLVFSELTNQPETVSDIRQILNPKIWIFLWAFFLLFLIGIGAYIGFSLGFGIFAFIITAVGFPFQDNFVLTGIVVLIGIVIFVIALSLMIRLLTRFFIFDMPLTVEENITATKTLGRSWELTKGYIGRIFMILLVANLVSIPIYIVIQIIAAIIQGIVFVNIPVETIDPSFQLLSFLVGYAIGILGNIFLLPFWQAIKAVIYYDLRTRREGMGLELRKREI
ncbi:hypothetical protein [Okeania sp.]|uniref:hypothetical protein n=1 Tax=Okeania sp. TaxID=3100323 RepID=UPI002B4B288E|nr:hypothetical protein [Okeania sp.]MEB3340398.1 hypothetical protein [Okeania sp.]